MEKVQREFEEYWLLSGGDISKDRDGKYRFRSTLLHWRTWLQSRSTITVYIPLQPVVEDLGKVRYLLKSSGVNISLNECKVESDA